MNTVIETQEKTIKASKPKRKIITSKLSIRRKKDLFHIKGDDPEFHTVKIGSSFAPNSKSHLSGLSFIEEEILLPSILGIDPKDIKWREAVKNYWSSISVNVPADGVGTDSLFGKVLEWTIEFNDANLAEKYDEADLQLKGKISAEAIEKGTARIMTGLEDFVLFRYCLVYGRVANNAKDANKSNRIWFYLHSKRDELKTEHALFNSRKKARELFYGILDNEVKVDGVLRMFKVSPDAFDSLEAKHLILEQKLTSNPKEFVTYITDSQLAVKAFIFKGVDKGIIHNPGNTDSYYYGENKEVLLGNTLEDAVLYCISTDEKKKGIVETMKAQLKHIDK